jgi:hypothetical protein
LRDRKVCQKLFQIYCGEFCEFLNMQPNCNNSYLEFVTESELISSVFLPNQV